jgi:uncharacterized protein (DUF934 family)
MMALIRDGRLVEDQFVGVANGDEMPDEGPIIVSLARWQSESEQLLRRGAPVGVRLKSDEHPEVIAGDLGQLAVVALEFPVFRDGRAYSYARLLRDRYGFEGEVRAIGDVLLEQLHYMERVGFNAFELDSDDPERAFRIASEDFSAWYQPAADRRVTAAQLRNKKRPT